MTYKNTEQMYNIQMFNIQRWTKMIAQFAIPIQIFIITSEIINFY